MSRHRLSYFEHCVEVALPPGERRLPRFLRAYFEPWLRLRQGAAESPLARIEVRLGPAPPEAPAATDGVPIEIDRSKAFLRCFGRACDRGDVRWVHLRPFGVTARIDRRAREAVLWGPSSGRLCVPLLRLVEDLVLDEVQRQGGIVLHASGVITGGGALLVLGNKGAGKTSILCRSLHAFEVAKLANDNVCLVRRGRQLTARGWPSFFKVEVATVASLTELAPDYPERHLDLLGDDDALWAVYEKVALYPSQGAARFGAPVRVEAPLAGLLLPRFGRDLVPGLEIAPIDEVAAELPQYLQGVYNPNHTGWHGIDPVTPERVDRAAAETFELLRHSGTPAFRLRWAPSLEDFLGRLPLLRETKKSLAACRRRPERDGYPALPGDYSR